MQNTWDILIVGASFAGLACAHAAAGAGVRVAVMERKAGVGAHLHTTGILTAEAAALLPDLPPSLVRPVGRVRLYGPRLRPTTVRHARYRFFATDTPALMAWMADRARAAGADILLGTEFRGGTQDARAVHVNGGALSCRLLVGADGGRSSVARAFGLPENRRFLVGAEWACAGLPLPDPGALHVFLTRRHAPGYIGWAVPGPRDVVQFGLARTPGAPPDLPAFWDFAAPALGWTHAPDIVEERRGVIPVGGRLDPIHKGRVVLTGDAAGLVSPLTAGGIHTALAYGARLGALAAAHLRGAGPHPGPALARAYPTFRMKGLARRVFEALPDPALDAAAAAPALARGAFFWRRRIG
jgi:digeranylgeranylglycerophospholipid reductase